MIERFQAENYGPLKRLDLALTPLHALIGPNDSGKSTILRGLLDVVQQAIGQVGTPPDSGARWERHGPNQRLTIDVGGFAIRTLPPEMIRIGQRLTPGSEPVFVDQLRTSQGLFGLNGRPEIAALRQAIVGAQLVRLDADQLRESSGLLTEKQQLVFLNARGNGLPGIYDFLRDRSSEAYEAIRSQFKGLFPTVKHVTLQAVSAREKAFAVELKDGTIVPAAQMSEGMLYFLAYAALRYLKGASILLIEEPENGLHPSRITEVMKILRTISESGTQVLLATHSPLVINELKPEEVTVVTRTPEQGTIVTPIKDTPRFAERSKVYALGELWLSYADGLNESALLNGEPRREAAGS